MWKWKKKNGTRKTQKIDEIPSLLRPPSVRDLVRFFKLMARKYGDCVIRTSDLLESSRWSQEDWEQHRPEIAKTLRARSYALMWSLHGGGYDLRIATFESLDSTEDVFADFGASTQTVDSVLSRLHHSKVHSLKK